MAQISAPYTPMITNFSGGMISPKMEGRIDLQKYHQSVKTLENMIIYPLGSATCRPGTEYIASLSCSTYQAKLFSFVFSVEEAYILEFGQNKQSSMAMPGYLRFFQVYIDPITLATEAKVLNGTGPIEYVPNPYTLVTSYPWVFNPTYWEWDSDFHKFNLINFTDSPILYTSLIGLATGVTKTYILNVNINKTGNQPLKFAIGTSTNIKYTSPTTNMPRSIFATFSYKAITSTDKLYIIPEPACEGILQNISLRDYSEPMILDSPYSSSELSEVRTAQLADVMYLVHPDHLPYKLSRYSPTAWNLSTYTIIQKPDEWNDEYGYPTAVALYQQRLWMGGNYLYPQRVWSSVLRSYDDFSTSVTPELLPITGIRFDLSSVDTVDRILWMLPHKKLLIGTIGSIWKSGSVEDSVLTAANVTFIRESSIGVTGVKALTIGNEIMFLGRLGKTLYSMVYSLESGGYKTKDLSILNDTIIKPNLMDMVYQQENTSAIWCLTSDNRLISCTYYFNEDIIGWAQHFTNDGTVESIAVIPNKDGFDQLWCIVQRTKKDSGGVLQNIRYVERMMPLETELNGISNAWYLDCAIKIPTYNVNVFSLATSHYTVGTTVFDLVKVVTNTPHNLTEGQWCKFFDLSNSIPPVVPDLNLIKYNNLSFKVYSSTSATCFFIYAKDTQNYIITYGYLKKKLNYLINLDWVAGKQITVFGDGAPLPDVIVGLDGTVTTSEYFCDAIVGYKYSSLIETLRIDLGSPSNSMQGRKKRVFAAILRFYNTIGAKYGITNTAQDLDIISFRSTNMSQDQPVSLFTGDKMIRSNTGFNRDGRVVIKQDQPLPMTVLGIIEDLSVHDI